MKIILRRVTFSKEGPTYGVLLSQNIPLCVTLERPWSDNAKTVSCIPSGTYTCVKHNGEKFKDVWRLESVPGRDAILIHAANYAHELQGCIAVGRAFFQGGITSSKDTLNELRQTLPDTFTIEVINP